MSLDIWNSLTGSLTEYKTPTGSDLLGRTQDFFKWQNVRRDQGYWPYSKSSYAAPTTTCAIEDDAGTCFTGVNYASQDYLSLAAHPGVHDAAVAAIRDFGVHSAGSAAVMGNTRYSLALEHVIADMLHMEHVILYPTGWGAGYGVITGLVRSADHVVMDALSHSCLQAGAAAATQNVRRFRHNDLDHLRKTLQRVRASDRDNAILVVTESLFSMDSDWPDIRRMQEICREHEATLVVDVAHDFGALGPSGTGNLGAAGLLGQVDLVMGSFSKTFASNGGFVATHRREVKEYLKCYSSPQTFSNAMSPVQTAVVLKAFEIVRSPEGDERRRRLMSNIMTLRGEMSGYGIEVSGLPSAIVPVVIGAEPLIRIASQLLTKEHVLTNLVEYPAVPRSAARFRFQVMADHTAEHAAAAVKGLRKALRTAKSVLNEIQKTADETEWKVPV